MFVTEAITNVLDFVAFLLVTIDLYGRDRLDSLRQKLISVKLPELGVSEIRKKTFVYNGATLLVAK